MQKCPRTPSHEVCPCTHTLLEPLHARQGINKETYPSPNKPPPRAPRRRPTTHVRILCFLHSRPFARRKKAWYEGHRYVTKRREPHATGGRTNATKDTYHKHAGAQEGQEVCPRTYMPPQTTKGMDVQNKGHRGWRHMQRQTRPANKETATLSPFSNMHTLWAAAAEENVDTAKEHTKNKRPPTPRNGIRMV